LHLGVNGNRAPRTASAGDLAGWRSLDGAEESAGGVDGGAGPLDVARFEGGAHEVEEHLEGVALGARSALDPRAGEAWTLSWTHRPGGALLCPGAFPGFRNDYGPLTSG
jgi:hypothetical protein